MKTKTEIIDRRKFNNGHPQSGRKPKSYEQKIYKKLKPLEPMAMEMFEKALEKGYSWALRTYFLYMYPKASLEVSTEIRQNEPETDYSKLSGNIAGKLICFTIVNFFS